MAASLLLALAITLVFAGPAAAAETTPVDTTPLPESVTGGGSDAVSTTSGAGAISRMVVGLGIVLVVIFGVYWLLKRVYGGRSGARIGEGLDVVATVGLGPNRTLQLVRIGDEYVLVGVAGEAVTSIRNWNVEESRRLEASLLPGPQPVQPVTPTSSGLLDEIRRRTLRQ
jgi:flagellar biosynthetic protein FliO